MEENEILLEETTAREETPDPEREAEETPAAPEPPEENDLQRAAEEEVRRFRESYPGADLTALLEPGSAFVRFSRGRLGTVPLTELYADYKAVVEQTREETLRTTAVRQNRSTAAASARAAGDYGLTDAQKELLADWNRRNPKERMTAKEYAALLKR